MVGVRGHLADSNDRAAHDRSARTEPHEGVRMAGKALKGHGLGSKSMSDASGVELAARQDIAFDCGNGHHFTITFAEEAALPTEWECAKCGSMARRSDGSEAEAKEVKHIRTHWDMLRERRSIEELEGILAERLQEMRKDQ
jgi:hypothetical protein